MNSVYEINTDKALRTPYKVIFSIPSLIVSEGTMLPSNTSYTSEGDRFRITGELNTTTVKTGLEGEIKFEVTNNGPDIWYGTPEKNIRKIKKGETVYISQPTYGDFRMGSESRVFDVTISEPVVSVRYKEQAEVNMFIINTGNINSYPIIKIEKENSESTTIQVGSNRISYIFPRGEEEVEIDTKTSKAFYKGENRDAFLVVTDKISLEPGVNVVLVKDSSKVEVTRTERWV